MRPYINITMNIGPAEVELRGEVPVPVPALLESLGIVDQDGTRIPLGEFSIGMVKFLVEVGIEEENDGELAQEAN